MMSGSIRGIPFFIPQGTPQLVHRVGPNTEVVDERTAMKQFLMSYEVIDIWVDQPFRFIAVICLLVFFRCIIHCSELKSILSPFEQQQKLKELKHSVSACLAFMNARIFMVLLGCGGGLSRGHIWVFLFPHKCLMSFPWCCLFQLCWSLSVCQAYTGAWPMARIQ